MAQVEKYNLKNKRPNIDIGLMVHGKVPPQAKELEEAILGAIMLDKSAYDYTADILTPDCFYVGANQHIFSAMQTLANKNMPIDLLTVVNQLKISETLEIVGGMYYVVKLTNAVTSSANVQTHARIVLQKHISREVIRVAGELITDAFDDSTDAFELLDGAEEKVSQIGSKNIHGGMMDMDCVLKQALVKIEEWRQNDGTLTGVTTGFAELDKATRGWQAGDLIIIGARPSVGKTALALNLIRTAALNNEKRVTVAVWSLEMRAVYLALRMLAAESEIYLHRLQTGRLDDGQMIDLITKGVDKLKKAKIFFDDSSAVNLRMLRANCRRLKKKNNLGLVVIDYLQLMEGEEGSNREQQVSKISRGLKNLAKELDVPIIALSQLTRESDKTVGWGKAPATSSLRESGSIEQDADMVLLLWGPTEEDIKGDASLEGKRKLKIAKHRNGMLLTIELDFKNEIQLFKAIDSALPNNFKPAPSYRIDTNPSGLEDDNPF